MTTEAQVAANRLNAQKSTGPRTPEGKAIVARNAVKHGLLGEQIVVEGEDRLKFAYHRDEMMRSLTPVGEVEITLAERLVGLSWRLQRIERLQVQAFETLCAGAAEGLADEAGLGTLGGAGGAGGPCRGRGGTVGEGGQWKVSDVQREHCTSNVQRRRRNCGGGTGHRAPDPRASAPNKPNFA